MREMAHIPNWRIAYSGYFDAWVGRMKDDDDEGLLGTGETGGRYIKRRASCQRKDEWGWGGG